MLAVAQQAVRHTLDACQFAALSLSCGHVSSPAGVLVWGADVGVPHRCGKCWNDEALQVIVSPQKLECSKR
jgi:hypothetical protein